MLFAIDVGNSHTVSGLFKGGKLVNNWRLKSDKDRTGDELAIRYHSLLQMAGIIPGQITGLIISSVVPQLETSWLELAETYFKNLRTPPITVSHILDTGITLKLENPAEVGADRIVNAVAAWKKLVSPFIVIDFGTAITFDCVNESREYLGGTIHPGIGISLDALSTRTAKLPRVNINVTPEQAIGTTTVKAIHSGMLYGFGGMVDRMVDILSKEFVFEKEDLQTIATGGMAKVIAPYTHSIDHIDPFLTLNGLQIIFNQQTNA